MRCPHCGYEDVGWSSEDYKGDFYTLPIDLTRQSDSLRRLEDRASVYGCPVCKKLFLVD